MGSVVSTAAAGLGLSQAVDGLGETLTGSRAKERALDASKEAIRQANAANDLAWARQQQEMEPWKAAGAKALAGLQDGSFFQKDAGYLARLEEGNKSINAGLAARGMGNSGAALKALTRYGQDYSSNEYQNAYNRQNNLVNYGNQASVALGNFAGGYGMNASNNAIGYGNTQAAAEIGQANRSAQLLGGFIGAGAQAAGAMAGGGGGKMSSASSSPSNSMAFGNGSYTGSFGDQGLSNQYGHNHWNAKTMWG